MKSASAPDDDTACFPALFVLVLFLSEAAASFQILLRMWFQVLVQGPVVLATPWELVKKITQFQTLLPNSWANLPKPLSLYP